MKKKESAGRMRRLFTHLFLFAVLALALTAAVNLPASETQAATKISTVKKKAKSIVKSTVNSNDKNTTKLKKLFQYAEENWEYQRVTGFKASSGWQRTYAYRMYKNKKGSCYHFAAGYAYLAKYVLGSKYKVRIALGQTKGFGNGWQDHAWVEIRMSGKWYIFDPNMDKFAADCSLKYYKKKRSSSAMKKVYNNYKNVTYITVKY